MGDIQDVFGGHEFDANQVEPNQAFEPLPAGWYEAFVKEAEVLATKAGTGFYLKLTLSIISPVEFKNRQVFGNLNLRNPNPQAEEIGLGQLSALGRAIGVMNIKDSADLLNKSLMVKLSVKNDEKFGPGNEVKGFKALEGAGQPAAPSAPATAGAPAAPAAPAGGYVPPWKKK